MRFYTLLLLLTYPALACALGLGDIELKSHLGEPLFAQVTISDIEGLPEPSCFVATDASDTPVFRKASIAFKQGNGDQHLSITTNEVITEPIVNLRVSFHCEPNINREYVLLLDPAPLTSTEKVAMPETQPVSDKQTGSLTVGTKAHTPAIGQNGTAASTLPPDSLTKEKRAKNKVFKKPVSVAPPVDEMLADTRSDKQQSAMANASQPNLEGRVAAKPVEIKATTNKPALVISGGDATSNALATQPGSLPGLNAPIDLAKAEASAAPLAATDAADEMAMMTVRLAHLEKQITTLQNQNAQLLVEAERAKNSSAKWSDQQSRWQQYLLIALSIVAILAGAIWLRRKILRRRLAGKHANWFDAEAGTLAAGEPTTPSRNNANNAETTTTLKEPAFVQPIYDQSSGKNQSRGFTNTSAFTGDDKDESESVLEHADVFIAHGRPALAIQLLQSHLADLPTESPAIWLKLLNLLAKEGTEAEYDRAVIECNQFFNIKMPSFTNAIINDKSTIEDYPHILARLESIWGSPLATEFLNDLIYNQKSQPRDGFERGTFEELFFLKQIAEILNPSNPSNQRSNIKQANAEQAPETPQATEQAINQTSSESLFDATDTNTYANNESLAATSGSERQTSLHQPVPSYEIDMLLDVDEASDIKETPADTKFNVSADSPLPETDPIFLADEIDFSIPADEIDMGSALEVNMPDEEIIFESDKITLQDGIKGLSENESEPKKQTTSNTIEWDLPKLDKQ